MKRLGITASGLVVVALVAACGGSATPTPAGSEAAASAPASAAESASGSVPASAPSTSTASVAPPPSALPSASTTPASQPASVPPSAPAVASLPPANFAPVTVTGRGNRTVAFTIPAGPPAIAVIRNAGKRPFSVTTLAVGGAQNDRLVAVTGSFQGTFLLDKRPGEHSVAFRIRSDGLWQIDVRPVSMARVWDGKQGLAGQGNDVVQLGPVNTAPLPATLTHVGTGRLVMNVYTPSPSLLVNETGPYDKPVTFPVGTVLIEVLTATNWGLVPG